MTCILQPHSALDVLAWCIRLGGRRLGDLIRSIIGIQELNLDTFQTYKLYQILPLHSRPFAQSGRCMEKPVQPRQSPLFARRSPKNSNWYKST